MFGAGATGGVCRITPGLQPPRPWALLHWSLPPSRTRCKWPLSSSPIHFETTTMAKMLLNRLVTARISDMKRSTPSSSVRPAAGRMPKTKGPVPRMLVFGNLDPAPAWRRCRRTSRARRNSPASPRPAIAGEHDSQRLGPIDAADGAEIDLPRRDHARRRMRDALIARLDIGRGQFRPVVEQHVRPQLEGIGLSVGRHGPGVRQIADDLRVVRRIELQQGRVVRRPPDAETRRRYCRDSRN